MWRNFGSFYLKSNAIILPTITCINMYRNTELSYLQSVDKLAKDLTWVVLWPVSIPYTTYQWITDRDNPRSEELD
jgi:hypothetical protein